MRRYFVWGLCGFDISRTVNAVEELSEADGWEPSLSIFTYHQGGAMMHRIIIMLMDSNR